MAVELSAYRLSQHCRVKLGAERLFMRWLLLLLAVSPTTQSSLGSVKLPEGGEVFISSVGVASKAVNTSKLQFTQAQNTACDAVHDLLPATWGHSPKEKCAVAATSSWERRDPEHHKEAFKPGGTSGLFFDRASFQHMVSHWKLKVR